MTLPKKDQPSAAELRQERDRLVEALKLWHINDVNPWGPSLRVMESLKRLDQLLRFNISTDLVTQAMRAARWSLPGTEEA